MTAPRKVEPGRFYMITRRCLMRLFLLRPDDETNNAFTYCLAEAALLLGIDVLNACAMSNHYHAVIYDRDGCFPDFMHRFHAMLARSQNALRGRFENLWSVEEPCVVELVNREDVVRALVYVATNPVSDHLVEKVHHWPGMNGYTALVNGRQLSATRPRHFFRPDGPMPHEVTLELVIPRELGPREEIVREIRERVEAVEKRHGEERRATGRRVLGRRRILDQSWRASPSTFDPRRTLRPRVAAKNKWARIAALQRNQEFIHEYRVSRKLWLAGFPTTFPSGTYWLRRFAGVQTAPPSDVRDRPAIPTWD